MMRTERRLVGAVALTCLFACSAEPPAPPAPTAVAAGDAATASCRPQQDALAEMTPAIGSPEARPDIEPAVLLQELAQDNERIRQAHLAFLDLVACRQNEAQRVHARFDRGELAMDDANTAILDIRSRITADYALADEMVAGMTRRSERAAALLDAPNKVAPIPAMPAIPARTGIATVGHEIAIRAEASGTADRIGSLAPGDQVKIVAARGVWRRIELPDDASGFIPSTALAVPAPAEMPPPATAATALDATDRARLEALRSGEREARQDFESAVVESRRQLLVPQQASAPDHTAASR